MIDWKKRRVSRVRLYKLFELVDKNVADAGVRRLMKNKIMEILYLPIPAPKREEGEGDNTAESEAEIDAQTAKEIDAQTAKEIARSHVAEYKPEDDEGALFEEFSSFSICGF